MFRFSQNQEADNVLEAPKPILNLIKGRWRELYFRNNNPIIVEVACGRGEYTTGLAAVYPDKNFIGIDIKGDRLWKGSQVALQKGLTNVAFLRTHIQNIQQFFAENEVDEIWIVHPDPRPKLRDARRRLTSPRFLNEYRGIIKDHARIRLKTDSDSLFEYSLELLKSELISPIVKELDYTTDLYTSPLLAEHHGIHTKYETLAVKKGLTIKYLQFTFDKQAWNTAMYVKDTEDDLHPNELLEDSDEF